MRVAAVDRPVTDAARRESIIEAVLALPPHRPRDIALFSSNTLFGEPGIYPDGPPMVPAPGSAIDDPTARRALEEIACPAGDRLDDPDLVARAPDAGVRAGLVALSDTVAEPLLDAFVAGTTAVRAFALGRPASPGRVVGPASEDAGSRVVNERYRAEHPALLALSLTHDLLWRAAEPNQVEEATLHALGAMVHLQLVARRPELGHAGTELARRQGSLALTLLNSRRPGHARISVVAPDGPGTIPGGAPALQTPDFWSIPFVGGATPPTGPAAPDLLGACLSRGAPDAPLPRPLRYEPSLGQWLSEHLGREWLPPDAHLRAAVALGAVDDTDLAGAAGLGADGDGADRRALAATLGVADALACFERRA